MNELSTAYVDADMVNFSSAGAEENQVARFHLVEADGPAGLALLGGSAWDVDAVGILVYVLGQAAAIKAFVGCFTTVFVTYAQNVMRLRKQGLPCWSNSPCLLSVKLPGWRAPSQE